jgi:hypothetical protein
MHPARQLIGRLIASILLATHLAVVGMAASPALHHWLHHDEDKPDHHCAVTAMIDGQLDCPAIQIPTVSHPLVFAEILNSPSPARPHLGSWSFSPGERAPPARLS